ncbi:hypothetical protein KAU45_06210 [bacterium]|nr:hypothetical protein [bacterium]
MNRFLVFTVPFTLVLIGACTDLPINVHGDTPTDGQLKIVALTDVVDILARRPEMMPGLIQEINDVSSGDKTALHERLEEELISVLTRRGYFVGAVAAPTGESEVDEALREAHEEKERVMSDEGATDGNAPDAQNPSESSSSDPTSSSSPTEGFAPSSAKAGTLDYRLVECRVIYTRAGSGVRRRAVAEVHFRVPSFTGDGYAWVGNITGTAEDVVSTSAAEELIDTRYADIGPQTPEVEETPILEPIIVTAVTVGLIVLFSFTSQ